jgi:two-component system, sensor histidine kinase and response regulator
MDMDSDIDDRTLQKLRTLGGEELVSKMALLFISQAESAVRDAITGFSAGNFESVQHAAHSLKSSAGNLGAWRVQNLADRVEQLAEQRSMELQPLLADLQTAFMKARDRLSQEIHEGKL